MARSAEVRRRTGVRHGEIPLLSLVATGVAVVAAVLQYTVPAMVPALERVPGRALLPGQWWRAVTPLLVQSLGWYQVVANVITLALIGVLVERLLGRRWWAVLFVAGTVGGEVAAYSRHEPGGGDSIAVCGLAGGAAVLFLLRPAADTRFATRAVACYVAALAGWGFGGPVASSLACLAVCLLSGLLQHVRDGAYAARSERAVLVGTVLCCVAMALGGDLHGVSLVTGGAVAASAAPVLWRRNRRRNRRRAGVRAEPRTGQQAGPRTGPRPRPRTEPRPGPRPRQQTSPQAEPRAG